MKPDKPFSKDIILLEDVEFVVNEIAEKPRKDVLSELKRFGSKICK